MRAKSVGKEGTVIQKWCDPWEALWARIIAYTFFGWFFLHDASTFAPWKTGSSWAEILFGLVLLLVPIVTTARSLPSVLSIDRAKGTIEVKRVPGLGLLNEDDDEISEDRIIQISEVECVVLTPQKRAYLIWPYQLQLRLRDSRRAPISTIASYEWLMISGARRLAEAINCPFEAPDEAP